MGNNIGPGYPLEAGSAALLELLLQDSRYGSLLVGADGCIVNIAGGTARLLQRSADDLIGQRFDQIARCESLCAHNAVAHCRVRVAGRKGEVLSLTCQQLPGIDPGIKVIVLRADTTLNLVPTLSRIEKAGISFDARSEVPVSIT